MPITGQTLYPNYQPLGAVVKTPGVVPGAPAAAVSRPQGFLGKLGSFFGTAGAGLLAGLGVNIFGMRQQAKQAEQARQDALLAQQRAEALQRQQIDLEMENARLDRMDAQAAQQALNEYNRRKLAADEEEILYRRGYDEDARAYTRGRDAAKDERLVPYRGVSNKALAKLSGMWGL